MWFEAKATPIHDRIEDQATVRKLCRLHCQRHDTSSVRCSCLSDFWEEWVVARTVGLAVHGLSQVCLRIWWMCQRVPQFVDEDIRQFGAVLAGFWQAADKLSNWQYSIPDSLPIVRT
jgi:hypothetical protein